MANVRWNVKLVSRITAKVQGLDKKHNLGILCFYKYNKANGFLLYSIKCMITDAINWFYSLLCVVRIIIEYVRDIRKGAAQLV